MRSVAVRKAAAAAGCCRAAALQQVSLLYITWNQTANPSFSDQRSCPLHAAASALAAAATCGLLHGLSPAPAAAAAAAITADRTVVAAAGPTVQWQEGFRV